MVSDRIIYLDLVKFVAILLVCIGHCYAMAPTMQSIVNQIISSFHMPLFMLVCGYFSFNSLELSFSKLISKKFCQLLIPVLSCTILSMSLFKGGGKRTDWKCVVPENSVFVLLNCTYL